MTALPSIRRRLLVSLMVPLAVLLPIVVVLGYVSAVGTARSAFDHGLADDATALASRASTRPDGSLAFDLPPAAEAILRMDSQDREYLAAWGPDGRLLTGDADLLPSADPPSDRPRVDDAVIRGERVRKAEFRFATAAGPVTVVFAETLRKRTQAEARIFFSLVVPNSLLVLLAVLLVHFSVSRSLAPLLRLSHAIATRSVGDIRPLERADVDREVLPLVDALNGLMAKLAAAAAAQRRFLADAAHQLRTPLAGLQTQIDLVAADLPEAQRARVEALAASAGRVGHLSQQLLALARSAPEAAAGHALEDVDIAALIEDRATDWHDAALKRGADLGFELAPASVRGVGWLLGEMLSNLVDNALRHGGRHVTVRCGVDGDGARFAEVEDDGAGIAEAERNKIFDRFYRGRSSDTRGTGLGLAIVREVADGHGARLEVAPGADGRGVRFTARFVAAQGAGRD
jgi:two-component system sensor histidine kinase TctE